MTINTIIVQLIASSIQHLYLSSEKIIDKKYTKEWKWPSSKSHAITKDEQGRPRGVASQESQVLDLQKASRSRLDFSSFSSNVVVSTYEDIPIESHGRK